MMKKNFTGNYCSYSMFPVITENIIMNNDFLITGVGGAVLMKKHIRDELRKSLFIIMFSVITGNIE